MNNRCLILNVFCSDLWDDKYQHVLLHQSHVSAFPRRATVFRKPQDFQEPLHHGGFLEGANLSPVYVLKSIVRRSPALYFFFFFFSILRGPSSGACIGRCGTTTRACQGTRVSSTMRTSSSGCRDSARSESTTRPAPSTKISGMKFKVATVYTPPAMRTTLPLALKTEQRKAIQF